MTTLEILGDLCCAFNNSTRCQNPAVNCSKHCDIHRPKANILYNKYKKLSDLVDTLDLNKSFDNVDDHIEYINQVYILLNKTYTARSKHRNYAFVPECRDVGHDYQFVKLQKLLGECELILAKLYTSKALEASNASNASEDSEDSEDLPPEPINNTKNNIAQKIREYRQHRKDAEKATDDFIIKYNKDNEEILHRRHILITYIVKFIDELFEPYDPKHRLCIRTKSIIMYNLTRELYTIGYFMKNFKPDRCEDRNCRCYIPYDLKLACHCALNTNTIVAYYNLSSESVLKLFYKTLLINKTKIEPLIPDIMALYDEYNSDDVMFAKVHLVWNIKFKRLMLIRNLNPTPIKPSEILAMNRVKHRHMK